MLVGFAGFGMTPQVFKCTAKIEMGLGVARVGLDDLSKGLFRLGMVSRRLERNTKIGSGGGVHGIKRHDLSQHRNGPVRLAELETRDAGQVQGGHILRFRR